MRSTHVDCDTENSKGANSRRKEKRASRDITQIKDYRETKTKTNAKNQQTSKETTIKYKDYHKFKETVENIILNRHLSIVEKYKQLTKDNNLRGFMSIKITNKNNR